MIKFVTELFFPQNILWVIIIFILIIGKFAFELDYISVIDIIKNHYKCFRNNKGKLMIVPIIVYSLIPFLMGYATATIKIIDTDTINLITVIISILAAMLFTLLAMIIDMKGKLKNNADYFSTEAKISKKALVETYYTVMFEILICIILLVLCFFSCFTQDFDMIRSLAIYSLTYLLIFNLLMIIKRIFRVSDAEMKK